MLSNQTQRLMQQEQKHFGVADGFKQFSPFPFGGMNQNAGRQGMQDQEFFYLENYIKVGPGNLRTLWDRGEAFYTPGGGLSIVYFQFFNIGATNYCAVFLSNGTAVQVNMTDATTTIISSTANTFYIGTQLPVAGSWGAQYLLIANNINSNAYWIWDRLTLYSAGGLGPQITITNSGSGYSSAPTVAFFGGSGTGAAATATVTAGAITSIQITNAGSGYKPGEVVQVQFTGGGSNNSAVLTAVLTGTTLNHISLLAGGSGYTSGVTVAITGGGGSGATATATQSGGVITSITLTAVGSGYTGTPTITFSDVSGVGAQAQIFLTPTTVASVTVTNGGNGFNTVPTLTFSGGGGTAATATATLTAKVITSVAVGAAGSGYTSTPAIIVQAGINSAASATATLMPFGVSGSSLETYQSRVWLPYPNQTGSTINSGTFLVSAPGSLTDFATSTGGLIFTSSDAFLRAQYTNIKQSNGYLYPFGDSSVSVISNVQTSGSPLSTTFNYQNTDPQIGTSWRDSLQVYSRTILFANVFGVFGLYGGAVTKISDAVDDLFNNAIFPPTDGAVTPTSAVAYLYNRKVYLINMTIRDPITLALRTILLMWDEKDWYTASQSSTFTFINTQEVNSDLATWGTDGTALYQLFTTPSATLPKVISTKLYGQANFLIQKEALGVYIQAQDLSSDTDGIAFDSITVDAEHGSYEIPNIASFPSTPRPYYAIVSMGSGDVVGANLGLTLTSSSKDFSVNFLGLGHIEISSLAMSSTPLEGEISTE